MTVKKTNILIVIFTFVFSCLVLFYADFGNPLLSKSEINYSNIARFLISLSCFEVVVYYLFRRNMVLNLPYKKIIYILYSWLFIICFFRPNLSGSINNYASIIFTSGTVVFLSSILHSIKLKKALSLMVLLLSITLFGCIYVHYITIGKFVLFEHQSTQLRVGGFFFFGLFGVIAGLNTILSFSSFLVFKSFYIKVYYLITSIIMAIFTILSDLRTAEIALLVCFFYVFVTTSRVNVVKKLIFLIVSLSMLVFLNYYIKNTSGGKSVEGDLTWRSIIWSLSIKGIIEKPFVGYGNEDYIRSTREGALISETLSDPHSSYLALILQSGIISFVLFLIYNLKLVIFFLKRGLKTYNQLIVLIIYWCIAASTGGKYFNLTSGFGQILFGLSLIGIMCHPEIFNNQQLIQRKRRVMSDNLNMRLRPINENRH